VSSDGLEGRSIVIHPGQPLRCLNAQLCPKGCHQSQQSRVWRLNMGPWWVCEPARKNTQRMNWVGEIQNQALSEYFLITLCARSEECAVRLLCEDSVVDRCMNRTSTKVSTIIWTVRLEAVHSLQTYRCFHAFATSAASTSCSIVIPNTSGARPLATSYVDCRARQWFGGTQWDCVSHHFPCLCIVDAPWSRKPWTAVHAQTRTCGNEIWHLHDDLPLHRRLLRKSYLKSRLSSTSSILTKWSRSY